METQITKYLPLTESTAYILLSLVEPSHGYAIMQNVEAMSQGTVKIGPGTLYGAFTPLESEGLIRKVGEADRRKTYALTDKGKGVIEYGISHTLEEIGKILGVTRERVRQREMKALRKLRHPTRRAELEERIEF